MLCKKITLICAAMLIVNTVSYSTGPCFAEQPSSPGPNSPGPVSAAGPVSAEEAAKRECKSYSWGLRHRRGFIEYDGYYYNLIGGLAKTDDWHTVLPLTAAQENVLAKLDNLVMDAGDCVAAAAADYIDTVPGDYEETMKRVEKRMHEAIAHAEQMTTLGLLTQPQAGAVLQHRLAGGFNSPSYLLSDVSMQELFGLTDEQKQALVAIKKDNESRASHWGELKNNEQISRQMVIDAQAIEDATIKILTQEQLAKWALLSYRHSVGYAPELPASPQVASPGAEAERVELKDVSRVFGVLADKAGELKLTAEQQKVLARLEEIAKQGLTWISLRDSDAAKQRFSGIPKQTAEQVTQERAEFLKQAEKFALVGILTEEQAEKVESLVK